MTGATATFDLVDLARLEASSFERQNTKLNIKRPWLELVLRAPFRALGSLIAKGIDNAAQDMACKAIFFRGARDRLEETITSGGLAIDKDLIARLEHMETELLKLRSTALSLTKEQEALTSQTAARVSKSFDRFVASTAELYEEVSNFRGAMLSIDADRSLRHEGFEACTPAELDEAFDRIFQGS